MGNKKFMFMHRLVLVMLSLGVASLGFTSGAEAALKKYHGRMKLRTQYTNTSPKVEYRSINNYAIIVIDEQGSNPVLKKFLSITDSSNTILTPGLSGGFIWYNTLGKGGPANNQTGTGNTADGSDIDWGNVAGWTTTGGTWCNSNPTYICDLAQVGLHVTIPSQLVSTNYDWSVGPWMFHGTGFTSLGYLTRTSTDQFGNQTNIWRGGNNQDGTVPAIPLIGIGAVGLSVFMMGLASMRRKR